MRKLIQTKTGQMPRMDQVLQILLSEKKAKTCTARGLDACVKRGMKLWAIVQAGERSAATSRLVVVP